MNWAPIEPWLFGVFAISALLYWWVGHAWVSRSEEERERVSGLAAVAIGLALPLSRIGLGVVVVLGGLFTDHSLLYVALVIALIVAMAYGPHPLTDTVGGVKRPAEGMPSQVVRGEMIDSAGRERPYFEVPSGGHPGVLGCVAAMGCLLGGGGAVLLVVVSASGETRIPEREIWHQVGWTALVVAFALAVFGWARRTVRLDVTGDGFLVTRTVLRWLKFRTFRRFDEITHVSTGAYLGVTADDLSGPTYVHDCCTLHVPGFLRSIRFAHGEPREAQQQLVKELTALIDEGRTQDHTS